MISEETKQRIDRLAARQDDYRPSDGTQAELADKLLVMLVGASCMGKSTVMDALEQFGSDLRVVGTTTTRPPRSDDHQGRYTYFDHSDSGLRPLLDDIEQAKVIQYFVNTHNGFIYASRIQDYPGTLNIGDYFSSVVGPFKSYGFKQIIPVTVVTEPAMWQRRFDARFPAGHPDRAARLAEAENSLRWSLAQPDMAWAVNRDGESQVAVTSVKNAIRGEIVPNEGRELANGCLKLVERLRA